MWRRAFITLVGGSVLALPIAAHEQQSAIPLIGYLGTGSPSAARELLTAFYLGLRETGYVEG
jgi:putative tryptophan/tyrosine transport system substrate-binding protein